MPYLSNLFIKDVVARSDSMKAKEKSVQLTSKFVRMDDVGANNDLDALSGTVNGKPYVVPIPFGNGICRA